MSDSTEEPNSDCPSRRGQPFNSYLSPRLRRFVPARVIAHLSPGLKRTIASFRDRLLMVTLAQDLPTFFRFWKLKGRSMPDKRGAPIPLRIRALGGSAVWARPGTTDAEVLLETFVGRFHEPLVPLVDPKLIWDLGANVGYTAAHLGSMYPNAKIIAIELDGSNCDLARRNLDDPSGRYEVVNAAVWVSEGSIPYKIESGREFGARITEGAASDTFATSITLNSLLARFGDQRVSYVKMDIEGAESRVLQEGTDWARSCAQICVEVHGGYSVDQASRDLQQLGFRTYPGEVHPASVHGLRDPV